MDGDPADRKTADPQSGGQQGESGIGGVNTDAITALNAAIGGVQLLGEVVMHIQQAASAVDAASNRSRISNGMLTSTRTQTSSKLIGQAPHFRSSILKCKDTNDNRSDCVNLIRVAIPVNARKYGD